MVYKSISEKSRNLHYLLTYLLAYLLNVYLVIASVFSDICLCAKQCYAKTAAGLSKDFLANQNIVTLP